MLPLIQVIWEESQETSLHAIQDCAFSKRIWDKLITSHKCQHFYLLDLENWAFAC